MCELCTNFSLPGRAGTRPATTGRTPHMQLDQNPPAGMHARLLDVAGQFADVRMGKSAVSFPDTTAFLLSPAIARSGAPDAFMAPGYEFAHLHAERDGSLHMCLPVKALEQVYAQGWGEPHPVAGQFGFPATIAMIYGPRNDPEFATVAGLLEISYAFAAGKLAAT